MLISEFNDIVQKQVAVCQLVLVKKGDEYSTDDKLHNFKVAARVQQVTPRQALGGMMAKHTVSIYDMIQSGMPYPIELWDEKITDHINYLLLLKAVVVEESQADPE